MTNRRIGEEFCASSLPGVMGRKRGREQKRGDSMSEYSGAASEKGKGW